MQSLAFRSAVTAADAYRSVRLAVRREHGVLRLGNRFVSEERYREVAFVALGNAANSMALAALHAVGDRLTQGFVAAPEPVDPALPFRGVRYDPGFGGSPVAEESVRAVTEIAEGLREQDLLVVLLSPGAVRALALPPEGTADEEFAELLRSAHAAGASGRELSLLVRVLGTGGVGGRLGSRIARADVTTLVVERGEGPTAVGGGPLRPVVPTERAEARAILERVGLRADVPARAAEALRPLAETALPSRPHGPAGARRVERPVVVATPTDAQRAAADALFDKGWTSRLGFLLLPDEPSAAADAFLARADELVAAERLSADSHTKGVATFAMLTLGVPGGVDEGPALGTFLQRAGANLRRREMSVGLFRTSGIVGDRAYPAGAVVGRPADPRTTFRPGRARAVPMRTGVTDVGLLAVALNPTPSADDERGRRSV